MIVGIGGKHWDCSLLQALSALPGSADAEVRGPLVGRGKAGEA